ncbi:MAG: lysophospholipid acyltransferase family protein [Azospirillaceae bacterium]|nr:lysophospholipid acyltransferase family protein [Azospirillaceae bacterium]
MGVSLQGSLILGLFRLIGFGLWTIMMVPVQASALALKLQHHTVIIPRLFHRVCARLLGFRLTVIGTPSTRRPTLYVANHSSYMDVVVLGGLIEGSFVAKTEVAGWPLFGMLAKLQRTVFVARRVRKVAAERDDIKTRLLAGDNLILFPEGTSSDGNRTLPFKSALFSVASTQINDAPIAVQPISVTCTALDGIPLGWTLRSIYAWYGDMDLAPHIWNMVQLGRLTVVVEFHEPVTLDDFSSRKALAEFCQATIAAGVGRAIAGWPSPTPVFVPSEDTGIESAESAESIEMPA